MNCVEQTLALRKGSSAAMVEANRLRSLMQYQGADIDVPDSVLDMLGVAVEEGIDELLARLKGL